MNVSIETFGCAVNQADSEVIAGLLKEHGFELNEPGEVVVVNTCTVKTPTENKIRKKLRRLEAGGRNVVVAGCLPAADPSVVDDYPSFSFIGVNCGDIVSAVEAVAQGVRYVNITGHEDKTCLPKVRANPVVEIIPLSEGCLGACTYCITKAARGTLKSHAPEKIIQRIGNAVAEGAREIWLTSQDNGAYGLDLGTNLPKLLNEVADVSGDFRVRVGMANPNHVAGFLDELVEAFADERFYRFLHVPVQSGNDSVLKDMGRTYTVAEYKGIVNAFRKKYDMSISTDVIAGYPTEGEDGFQDTVSLIKETRPDVLNVSRFWARPGTDAATLSQLPGAETKKRSRILNDVFREVGLRRNMKWMGWKGKCLVSQKNPDGTYTCRNSHYKPIVVETEAEVFGKSIEVEVDEATYFDLRGRIIKEYIP